jgi:hypothetical protein
MSRSKDIDKINIFTQKFVKIAEFLKELIDDPAIKDKIGKAGTIGSLLIVGIEIYKDLRDRNETDEERAFKSLFIFTCQSAKESLEKLQIDEIDIKRYKEEEKKKLFETFTIIKTWNSLSLTDHPVIDEFRKFIYNLLKNEQESSKIRNFTLRFNATLEEKADKEPSLSNFRTDIKIEQSIQGLVKYLKNLELFIYNRNTFDDRYLIEYYVENNALFVNDLDTWDESNEKLLSDEKYKNKTNSKSNKLIIDHITKEKSRYIVIGAPFGIGKTSLSIYICSILASRYLGEPENNHNYIPIFVPLKGNFRSVDDEGNSLDDILKIVAPNEEAKKKNLLLICDGLDEYEEDASILKKILEDKHTDYPNMKFMITTRLESGLPMKLNMGFYIRLLPFNPDQVNEFFMNYGLPHITCKELEEYKLEGEEISKPLFCWMFATMVTKESQLYSQILERKSANASMTRSLIYLGFIHSLVRGKHEHVAGQLNLMQYYSEEKSILRKIAALRQMFPRVLTNGMVIECLRNFYGYDYSDKRLQQTYLILFFLHTFILEEKRG